MWPVCDDILVLCYTSMLSLLSSYIRHVRVPPSVHIKEKSADNLDRRIMYMVSVLVCINEVVLHRAGYYLDG